MAARFTENTANFVGDKTRATTPMTQVTRARMAAQSALAALASSKGVSLNTIVTNTLLNALPQLTLYVQSKGEAPLQDPMGLCIQAILLRGQDISIVAKGLDISDEDALQSIESAESEYIATNTPDASNVFSPNVAAAITDALTFASTVHAGDGSMGSILKDVFSASKKVASGYGSYANDGSGVNDPGTFNSIDDMDLTSLLGSITDTSPGSSSVGTAISGIPAVDSSGIFSTDTGVSLTGNSAIDNSGIFSSNTGSSTGTGSSTASTGGIFGNLGTLLGSVTAVLKGVTTAANSAATAGGAINNAISNAGANSIATYISNNKGTIIFVVLLIVGSIVAIRYAGKH